MKITSVRCLLCTARNALGYQAGSAIVRVETDAGVVGHGETLMGLFCAEVAQTIVRYYEPLLVGKSPADIPALWQLMFDSSVWWGRAGAAPSVIGGIESALWDIAGKVAGKPCWQLLAESTTDATPTIPVYASLGSAPRDAGEMKHIIARLREKGFLALKIGLQFGAFDDTELLAPRGAELVTLMDRTLSTIRSADPDILLIVDGHSGGVPDPITRDEALAVARVLERYDVSFFEEPLSYLDRDEYAWLRQNTRVRIAGGESLSLVEMFRDFIEAGALDLVQPDANFVGGIGQTLRVARFALDHGLAVIPHAWCGGPGIMSNIHATFAIGKVERLEMPEDLTDLQTATVLEPPAFQGGAMRAPTAPGLGIDIPCDVCERFPFISGLAERASGLIFVKP